MMDGQPSIKRSTIVAVHYRFIFLYERRGFTSSVVLWCADWQTFADVLEVYSANMFRVKLSQVCAYSCDWR